MAEKAWFHGRLSIIFLSQLKNEFSIFFQTLCKNLNLFTSGEIFQILSENLILLMVTNPPAKWTGFQWKHPSFWNELLHSMLHACYYHKKARRGASWAGTSRLSYNLPGRTPQGPVWVNSCSKRCIERWRPRHKVSERLIFHTPVCLT